MTQYTAAFHGLSLVLGLCLGSFYNVCIHRTISGESVANPPRSKCPQCGHFLAWWENIPLLSYALLLGKCRSCRCHISARYPLVEGLSALIALALAITFGPGPKWAAYMAFSGLFIVISFIDLETYTLPLRPMLIGSLAALGLAPTVLGVDLVDSMLGAVVGAGLFWTVNAVYTRVRGVQGMGEGDVYLIFLIGALTGLSMLPPVIIISAATAGIVGFIAARGDGDKRESALPYGPFLCLAAILVILWGDVYTALVG